jgi:hypothetical protein
MLLRLLEKGVRVMHLEGDSNPLCPRSAPSITHYSSPITVFMAAALV